MSFALYRFTMFFACFVFPLCRFLNHQLTCLNLGGDLGLGVGDLDAQLLGAGNDVDALAGGDGRGNLGGVGAVVHHEELEVLDVVDQEGLVAGGHHVAGLLVGAVADLGGVFVRERSPRGTPRDKNVQRAWQCCHGNDGGHGCRYPWAFSSWGRGT